MLARDVVDLFSDEGRNIRFVEYGLAGLSRIASEYADTLDLHKYSFEQQRSQSSKHLRLLDDFAEEMGNRIRGGPAMEALNEFDRQSTKWSNWCRIAAKNAGLLAYGFFQTTQNINALTSKSPALRSIVDKEARSEGQRAFSQVFSDLAKARKPIAHPGEFAGTPADAARHSINGILFEGNLNTDANGSILSSSVEGVTVRSILSAAGLHALETCAERYQTAFKAQR